MILLPILPVFADAVAAPEMCAMARVVETVPRPEQTGVPVDVRLAAVLSGDCGGPAGLVLTLATADGVLVAEEETAWDGSLVQVFELYPDTLLEPETDYVFTITPNDGVGEVTELGFTTGTGTVVGASGVPSYVLEGATTERGSGMVATTGELTAAEDPDRLSLLLLSVSGAATGEVVLTPAEAGHRQDYWSGQDHGEVCVSVTQLDGSGAAVESEPACAEIVGAGWSGWSCSTAGGGGSILGVLLALGLARRRV